MPNSLLSNQWSVAQAKANFSALIRQAYEQHQPQIITHHGQGRVVVIRYDDWTQQQAPTQSLVDFLAQSPLAHSILELPTRDAQDDQHREVMF